MLKPNQKSKSSKKSQVEKMFDSISFEYDLLNGIMTFNSHKRWKKNILNIAKKLKPKNALDLATGTADIAINLGSISDCKVVGVDISEQMLNVGRKKITKISLSPYLVSGKNSLNLTIPNIFPFNNFISREAFKFSISI